MTRIITIVALTQLVFVGMGFFGLGIVLKICGYPDNPVGIRWNPVALMLRTQGLYFLFIPVIWTLLACLSESKGKFIFTLDTWLVIGSIAAIAVIIIFMYACVAPYTRGFFIL